jgi:glycine/D-amino acid oxidase-like deaminating enzyme
LATVDLTIRGAGIFGLSVAWAALSRGARVRVIDPHGVAAGASGGIVGALAPHVPDGWNAKKAFQFDSLILAEPFWAGVDAASGQHSGYRRTGRLQPLTTERDAELARQREAEAARNWAGLARWQVIEAGDAAGWAPPTPTGLLVQDTLSARIHPRDACESLASAILARGGEILREGPEEGAVVWATGWNGLKALSAALGKPVGGGVKGQAVLLRHRAPEAAPQIFAEGLHVIPHHDGTVAVGSTSEREFDDPGATDAGAEALIDRALEALPILHGAAVIRRWAGVRPRAKSRAPMLGPWPGRQGHFIANGGFKIGFGMAPKVAEVMAGLVLEGVDDVPEAFRVEANL